MEAAHIGIHQHNIAIYGLKNSIVDTKGVKTDVYKLKKKLMQYQGNDIEEV